VSDPVPLPGGANPPPSDPTFAPPPAFLPPSAGFYGGGPGYQRPVAPPPPGYPAYPQPGVSPEAPKKHGVLKIALLAVGLAGVLLVGLGIFGVSAIVEAAADPAKGAQVGDCLTAAGTVADAGTTETSADIVDCGSARAEFSVVARIEGQSSPSSTACDKFFDVDESYYVYGSTAGNGYVLCLRPKG
jgi:hypothetical protein